jgi:hypothetical protein
MTQIMVKLDDVIAARLRARAEHEGLSLAALIEREAARLADHDPFSFFGVASTSELRGADVKDLLAETGYGER